MNTEDTKKSAFQLAIFFGAQLSRAVGTRILAQNAGVEHYLAKVDVASPEKSNDFSRMLVPRSARGRHSNLVFRSPHLLPLLHKREFLIL